MHGSRFGKRQLARTNKIQAFGLRQVDFGSPTFVGGLRITLASATSASPDSPPSLLSHVEARIGDTDPPLSPADPNACLVNKLCFRTEGDVLHEGDCYGVYFSTKLNILRKLSWDIILHPTTFFTSRTQVIYSMTFEITCLEMLSEPWHTWQLLASYMLKYMSIYMSRFFFALACKWLAANPCRTDAFDMYICDVFVL